MKDREAWYAAVHGVTKSQIEQQMLSQRGKSVEARQKVDGLGLLEREVSFGEMTRSVWKRILCKIWYADSYQMNVSSIGNSC